MSDSESNSNYKSKENNNPNLLNKYVIYCFPKDSIINNISTTIIINKWNFNSCSTYYNERKAYLYINPESESSTQITLDFYDEYENDDTTLFFSDDYTGINEFYIYGMNNIKTNLMYIIILILMITCIQWNENSFDIRLFKRKFRI